MSKMQAGTVLHYLHTLAVRGLSPKVTDRELLARFGAGEPAAFAALVKRHGRLVWDVCRRALADEHDTEDAFQAVFIVLACKATSIRRTGSIGSWLHGVALRTAMNAKRQAARRRRHEGRSARPAQAESAPAGGWREVQTLLDEEVERLPAADRAAFIRCCMEGRSLADAARDLGKTEGATATALSRARKRLQQRLRERGVALGAVLAAVALGRSRASADLPAGLVTATIRAATAAAARPEATAAGVSHSVATLARRTIKEMTAMSMVKWGMLTVTFLAAAALAAGTAWLSGPARAERAATDGRTGTGDGGARGGPVLARIAWGEPVDGFVAGLEVAPEARTCRPGESVTLRVWVRNVGARPASLTYRTGWFYTSPPTVVRGKGARVPVAMPPEPDFHRPVFALTLKPGESALLGTPDLAVEAADRRAPAGKPTVRMTPGAFRVRYDGLSLSHPTLTTGWAELAVRAEAAARPKSKEPLTGAALRLADSSWQGKDGGRGPTFHADGTGRNPDGSRFEWRIEGDFLVARRLPERGKPGDWSHTPILISRDSREYRIVLELDKEYPFFRITPGTGKPDDRRTEEGRSFRRKRVPTRNDAAPVVTPVKPGADHGASPLARADGAVRVGPNVQVSKARAEVFHAEVVLAADPTDPRRLVAASMYSPPPADPAAPKVVVYASGDGGKSWAPTLERKDANPALFADPAFAWGAGDALFFVNLRSPSLEHLGGKGQGCLQLVRSRDGGRTWGSATVIQEYHDRPFLALDQTRGQYHGRLYCLTHKGLLVSTDAGRSFGPVRTWARRAGYVPASSGNPVVLSDGTLVVLYNNAGKRETPEEQRRHPAQDPMYLAVRTSPDGGASFSEERVLADYRGAGFAQAAAWRDRVYVVWQETLPGGRPCIRYTFSKDRGATFSRPVVLSEPSDAAGGHDAFVPSIAVNAAGAVAATWYDTRGLRPGAAGWDLRFRVSLDGGETWRPSVRVTDAPAWSGAGSRTGLSGVGHTGGLAADTDGVFHCLWVDGRSGTSQVYTAAVAVGRASGAEQRQPPEGARPRHPAR